jgi:hypothetical protein
MKNHMGGKWRPHGYVYPSCVSTFNRSLSHILMSSVTLPGSGFERRNFLCFWANVLANWLLSYARLVHWLLVSAGIPCGYYFSHWTDFQRPTSSFNCLFDWLQRVIDVNRGNLFSHCDIMKLRTHHFIKVNSCKDKCNYQCQYICIT